MKTETEIKEILHVKQAAVNGEIGKLTPEIEHDLKVQIEVLKWVLIR